MTGLSVWTSRRSSRDIPRGMATLAEAIEPTPGLLNERFGDHEDRASPCRCPAEVPWALDYLNRMIAPGLPVISRDGWRRCLIWPMDIAHAWLVVITGCRT